MADLVTIVRSREPTNSVAVATMLEDRREFSSPTGAAKAVNGDVSVNGWRVWTRNGTSLADLVDRLRR